MLFVCKITYIVFLFSDQEDPYKILNITKVVLSIVEGLLLMVISTITIMKLKNYFPKFYIEHKFSMIIVLLGLTLP